jgi:hypothetical protein
LAARGPGWRDLLDRECASSPQLSRYATDPREGDWIRLLDRLPARRALFLGNALAILPVILTEVFESVVVADWNGGRLALGERRRDEEAIDNLAYVSTRSADDLPEGLGEFDLIVLGEERPDDESSAPFADADAPRRLAKALVLDGTLTYGVRYSRSAMLAGALARGWRGGPPLSYPAHARLLAAAGFRAVRAYGRRPERRPYHVYVPLDEPAVVHYWIANGPRPAAMRPRVTRIVKRGLVRLGAAHVLFKDFLVIARRGR